VKTKKNSLQYSNIFLFFLYDLDKWNTYLKKNKKIMKRQPKTWGKQAWKDFTTWQDIYNKATGLSNEVRLPIDCNQKKIQYVNRLFSNKSCHTHGWVTPHMCDMSHTHINTHMSDLFHTILRRTWWGLIWIHKLTFYSYAKKNSLKKKSHITHVNISSHTLSHMWATSTVPLPYHFAPHFFLKNMRPFIKKMQPHAWGCIFCTSKHRFFF